MTTVGYGDVAAVSPFGKLISIINALWGAFIISLLMSIISKVFDLSENQKSSVSDITNSKRAAASIKTFFKYVAAKIDFSKNHQRDANNKIVYKDNGDYVYKEDEVKQFKSDMIKQADLFRDERKSNEELIENDTLGENVSVVKEQISELNDKFDFLVSLLLKSNKLGVSESQKFQLAQSLPSSISEAKIKE